MTLAAAPIFSDRSLSLLVSFWCIAVISARRAFDSTLGTPIPDMVARSSPTLASAALISTAVARLAATVEVSSMPLTNSVNFMNTALRCRYLYS